MSLVITLPGTVDTTRIICAHKPKWCHINPTTGHTIQGWSIPLDVAGMERQVILEYGKPPYDRKATKDEDKAAQEAFEARVDEDYAAIIQAMSHNI